MNHEDNQQGNQPLPQIVIGQPENIPLVIAGQQNGIQNNQASENGGRQLRNNPQGQAPPQIQQRAPRGNREIRIQIHEDEAGYFQLREENQQRMQANGYCDWMLNEHSQFNKTVRKYSQKLGICCLITQVAFMVSGSYITYVLIRESFKK